VGPRPVALCAFSGYHDVAQRRILLDIALTLVLRSTHSSQLNVGLLRFCFFFGGPTCVALLDASGLPGMEGIASSSMARLHAQNSLPARCRSKRRSKPSHVRAPCDATGISEDDVVLFPTTRGEHAVVQPLLGAEREGLEPRSSL
jgi:hypothetical protein